ncbi:class I SAM-dependent methyltransferase [Colwellia sp. BRX10-6]|uniref:class I SAM-dependent methyltransferase n=1 Tax=unclassified Colwellia TaxID=196834 RepID=UPI0015F36058|nr:MULTISPECIES: class I SAM-dependent methyltransferase [unclassified Colwellia]MBA6383650.1 class I SAM-dependent methyltransferase [Colwellia sp. BRX10-9]MBA6394360.1 class I SAM-dependent methyltransferase [Colwellia sp. BRX10-6]
MTIQFYQDNADDFFEGTVNVDMSNIYQHFTKDLNKDSLILDAGCGSGRDTKAFIDMGYSVEAFDASSELVSRASRHTGIVVKNALFNDVDSVEKYDAIWCCASLLHVPEIELPATVSRLAKALKVNGIWYVSFKYGDKQREKGGRSFTDINEQRLIDLVATLINIDISSTWITEDNRPDRNEKWLNAILIKS